MIEVELPAVDLLIENRAQTLSIRGMPWYSRFGFVSAAQCAIMITCYVCFFAIGLLIILKGGCCAQDVGHHVHCTQMFMSDPAASFADDSNPDPVLLYAVSVPFVLLTGMNAHAFVFPTCVLFLLLNLTAIHFFFVIGQRLSKAPVASALAVSFLAILPVTICSSVAYAPDALTALPFATYVYAMLLIAEKSRGAAKNLGWLCALACVSLCIGGMAKYSFIAFLPACALIVVAIGWHTQYNIKQMLLIALTTLIVPALTILAMPRHKFPLAYPPPPGAMSFSQYVPRSSDSNLLAAPTYWDAIRINGTAILVDYQGQPDPHGRQGYSILVNDRYSYPALLTLAINTDVSCIAQGGAFPHWREHRHDFNKRMQQWSMSLGCISALALLFALASAAVSLLRTLKRKDDSAARTELVSLLILALPTCAFYCVVALFLPFIVGAIYMGYWMPRLIYPSIFGFGIIALVGWVKLDAGLARWPKWRWTARVFWCTGIVAQTIVHALLLCT